MVSKRNALSPEDFMFQLNKEEADFLRSQIVTLKKGRGQHSKYLPYVFTKQGVEAYKCEATIKMKMDVLGYG